MGCIQSYQTRRRAAADAKEFRDGAVRRGETIYAVRDEDRKEMEKENYGEGYGNLDDGTFSPRLYLMEYACAQYSGGPIAKTDLREFVIGCAEINKRQVQDKRREDQQKKDDIIIRDFDRLFAEFEANPFPFSVHK